MPPMLHRTRSSSFVSIFVLGLLAGITVVMLTLPESASLWLVGMWTMLAFAGNIACLRSVRIRWQQRKAVADPRRQINADRRKALMAIATANVRRELVRGAEFGLFLFLGLAVITGNSSPVIGRGTIVLVQVLLLGNVIYDLIEMAYTNQFLEKIEIVVAAELLPGSLDK